LTTFYLVEEEKRFSSYGFEKIKASGRFSSCFRNFACLDAPGANLRALHAALRSLQADGLQVRVETAAGAVIRVGNIITKLRAFAADFASFSHDYSVPPSIKNLVRIISVGNQ
jgi:hypothetical protein